MAILSGRGNDWLRIVSDVPAKTDPQRARNASGVGQAPARCPSGTTGASTPVARCRRSRVGHRRAAARHPPNNLQLAEDGLPTADRWYSQTLAGRPTNGSEANPTPTH